MSSRSHIYYQDLLEQHVAGDTLSPLDRMELFDHVEECDDCRGILEAENRITERMKAVPRLMTPADLRAKIVSQAVRDHRERKTTPSEDPAVADLLKSRLEKHFPPPPQSEPMKSGPAPAVSPDFRRHTEEFPVFAGVVRPQPSRLRQAWRKAAPPLATLFMSVAALAALYAGQFQGVPLAGEAQQLVWAVVHKFQGNAEPEGAQNSSAPRAIAQATLAETPARESRRAESAAEGPARPIQFSNTAYGGRTEGADQALGAGQMAPSGAEGVRLAGPHPWNSAVASMTSVPAQVVRQTASGAGEVPSPAEDARPQIAALVLWATDRDNRDGGFGDSTLAAELETLALSQPGGHVAQKDQFAHEGHRYRLYTLDLPAGSAQRVVEELTPYEAPADGMVMNALALQSVQTGLPRDAASMQYYRSQEVHLRTALQTVRTVPVSHGRRERLRVVLVE